MKTTSDAVELPYYINCKEGFLKFEVTGTDSFVSSVTFLGHTKNMRAATPFYGNIASAVFLAKHLMRMAGVSSAQYFALVQPAIINFNKEKEIVA